MRYKKRGSYFAHAPSFNPPTAENFRLTIIVKSTQESSPASRDERSKRCLRQRRVVLFMIVVFDWARAFLSLLRGQVATCLSKGDFPAYLGICYRKKEEESNDFPNSVRKKNQFVRAGAEKQSTEWVPVVHK
ncbi:hypothetical protein Tco_0667801 [Tanacetum coccineum]